MQWQVTLALSPSSNCGSACANGASEQTQVTQTIKSVLKLSISVQIKTAKKRKKRICNQKGWKKGKLKGSKVQTKRTCKKKEKADTRSEENSTFSSDVHVVPSHLSTRQ